MVREVSHGQAACGSILGHQASNYDVSILLLGQVSTQRIIWTVGSGLVSSEYARKKKKLSTKTELQKRELILSRFGFSLALSHICCEDGKFAYTCP